MYRIGQGPTVPRLFLGATHASWWAMMVSWTPSLPSSLPPAHHPSTLKRMFMGWCLSHTSHRHWQVIPWCTALGEGLWLWGCWNSPVPLRASPCSVEEDCPADSSSEEGKACPMPFQHGRVSNIPSPRHFLNYLTYICIHMTSNVI